MFMAGLAAHAQSGMLRPAPAWKPGERRQVDVDRKLRITLDSTVQEVVARSSYVVEVMQAGKGSMEVAISTLATSELEAQGRLGQWLQGKVPQADRQAKNETLEGFYAKLEGLPTRYSVSLDGTVTEQVDAVRAVEKLRPLMAKLIPGLMKDMAARGGGATGALTAARMDFLTDSIYNALLAPQAMAFYQFMQFYRFSFPLTGSQRGQVDLKNAGAPWGQVYPVLQVMVEAGLDQQEAKRATTRRIVDYPAAGWLPTIAKAGWNEAAKAEGSSWTEECVEEYDREKTWPLSSLSETHFRCGRLNMHTTVRTTVKPVM